MKDTGIIRFDWIDEQMPKDEYSEDERKTMCYAVFMYRNGDGEEPIFDDRSLRTCWRNIKKEIDANVKKYEETTEKNRANGAKGGRPKNPQKPNETQNNRSVFDETQQNPQKPNETLYDNEYDNENENENDNDLKKEKDKKKKESKKPFGEFGNVMLTDAEYIKVQERFPLDYDDRIENLSSYIASHGKRYKSHYATLLQWAKKDGIGRNKASEKRLSTVANTGLRGDYSAEAMEERRDRADDPIYVDFSDYVPREDREEVF